MNKLSAQKRFRPPWIIAHRGYQTKYPENTLSAFKAALDAGASMIELDVTLSRDSKLVVIHDSTLERTTNGHGPVHGLTLAELKRLDAGSWFHPKFAGERLPELIEVLELVDGRALIDIEIKSYDSKPDHPLDAIERQVVELVRRKQARDYVLISSFNFQILQRLAAIEDTPSLALISMHPADLHTVEMCSRIKAFSWHPDQLVVTPEQVTMMHAAGIHVFPYNTNTTDEYARMLAMDVDGMIINDPLQAIGWLNHRKAA